MIGDQGWRRYCIWEHSAQVRALYARRCRREEPEMTCAAQAAELLRPLLRPGDSLLDVGCGSGYFYHSLVGRGMEAEYWGIDAAPSLLAIGRAEMPAFGLAPERLLEMRLEDLEGQADHVVCLNVLSNLDNYHRPLERLLHCARRSLVLRESASREPSCLYVRDRFLDPGVDLKVYVNTYPLDEMVAFIESHGFSVRVLTDQRTGGAPEMIIGYPHHWKFFLAQRNQAGEAPCPA